jgi:HK97 family phage major capsid protein
MSQELELVTKALDAIKEQVKETGESALKEAKKAGEMSVETKASVDGLLIKQGELMARLQSAEQKLDKRGSDEQAQEKSLGQELIDDKDFLEFVGNGGVKAQNVAFVMKTKAITSLTASGGTGVVPQRLPGVIMPPMRRMTVRDLIAPGRTVSNLVQYVKETGFTNNAATVSETVLKPESAITYALQSSPVVTIAHWIKAAKQILDDFAALSSMIDARLRYGLAYVEETQLLKGSGSGNNLNGIYTQATAYSAPITIASPTKIDVLRLMLLQATLAEYPPTGIVLHPSDWAAIELTKDTTGAYLFANPQRLASPTLWGLPIVATQAMTVDTALVGSFSMGAQIFDREDANVIISSENSDDFVKNLVTIRGEERLALAVTRPEAFIKNTDLPAT